MDSWSTSRTRQPCPVTLPRSRPGHWPNFWRAIARPRANSADAKIIDALLDTPILNADTASQVTGTTGASTYRALARLTEAGVLELLTASKRNQIWAATAVLAELDALGFTIGKRSIPRQSAQPNDGSLR